MTSLPPSTQPAACGGLSAVTVTEITEPTAAGDIIQVVELDAVQLESRPLRARRVTVNLETSVLIFHSTNVALRTRTKLPADFVAFTVFGPCACGTLNGLSVGPDRVLACGSGVEVEFVVSAGYESVALLLPCDELRMDLRRRDREDEFPLPNGVELLQSSPSAARELYGLARRLVDQAARQPDVFELPQTQAVIQTQVLEALLAALESTVQAESVPQDRTRLARSRIVQAAEDYVMAHAADKLSIGDLCEAAGVSERTLQYAFKEMMGMRPIAYLNRLRLHQVRRSLRAASHASTTVTREALRWGFWHFGDFSRAYKDCFGELPSDTLRRPANAYPAGVPATSDESLFSGR
jgi:AraC-like DNA-binding protein